jgi:hypothetical protein
MLVLEPTLECVLIGSIVDEALPSYCFVDPHAVGVSLGSLDVCKQPVDSPYDEDWKSVAPKKKNKAKGDGPAKAPKDLRKDSSLP